jgi:glycosyltransferase involved in cell wall biosynthesis
MGEFRDQRGESLSPVRRLLYRLDEQLFRWVVDRADMVVTLSDDLTEQICSNYGVDPDAVHVLPLGVDTDRFGPVQRTHDGEKLGLVYIGSISELRGLDTVVDGLSQLDSETRSELRLDLIGDADNEFIRGLLSRAEEVAPETDVEYHGYAPHDSLPELAGQSDVALSPLPALEAYNVSSPAKVYEYLGMGLPVIATEIPAHQRILDHEEDSLLTAPDAPDEFAEAVETLATDPSERARMGEQARAKACDHSWERRFTGLFDEVAGLDCAS